MLNDRPRTSCKRRWQTPLAVRWCTDSKTHDKRKQCCQAKQAVRAITFCVQAGGQYAQECFGRHTSILGRAGHLQRSELQRNVPAVGQIGLFMPHMSKKRTELALETAFVWSIACKAFA